MRSNKFVSDTIKEKRGRMYMAVLAKPVNKIPIVKEQNSREFIRKFNENKISTELLESCKKAGKLFGKCK